MILVRFAICMLALTLLAGAISYSSAENEPSTTAGDVYTD
jgi:hypothetical protein